jgi:hypothetical protein
LSGIFIDTLVSAGGVYLQNYYDNYSYMGSTHFPSSGYNPEGAVAYSKGMLTGKVIFKACMRFGTISILISQI